MEWAELVVGGYVGALGAFMTSDEWYNRVMFKAPLFPASALLIADATSRLGWLT